ncbi:hypothetical protein AAVH_18079 [Aphelenchoides avenae]|nr:hypothetical protein AAVH_18079 [Aphelenchus avenae]
MSLKEALSVFGPGFKNPTLSDIEQLRESLLEARHGLFCANTQIDIQPVLWGSRRFAIAAGTGSLRECTGSDIQGCPALPQVVLQPASHSRASSKFRLFTKDDCRVLAVVTTVDLDGRSSTIRCIKPAEETDDYFSISRQQTTITVTALMLSTSKLMERLEHARKILANAVPSNLSSNSPPSTSVAGFLAIRRRRRHQKPYIPRQIRYDRASLRASSLRWSFKPSCILAVCAIPLVLVLWHSAPTEFVNDENRTSYATESSELEQQRRKILTLRTYDFSSGVSYSTGWLPTATDIEKYV